MEADEFEYDGEAPRFWFSSRFALAVLGFVGFLSMSSQRTCMKVAMVCMLNHTAIGERNLDTGSDRLATSGVVIRPNFNSSFGNDTDYKVPAVSPNGAVCQAAPQIFVLNASEFANLFKDGEFMWSESRQKIVFDTYYWGYIIAQVPAGWLAQHFGGKRIFGYFLLAGSLSTALIPIASRTHFYLLIMLRFLGGAGAGGTFPAMHTLWGKWAPPLERSLLASITYAGSLTGSVFIYPVAGLLCKYGIDGKGFDGGWPAIFYIFGALGVLWFALWMVFASESPADHGRINDEEKHYIEETLAIETVSRVPQCEMHVPWSDALSSFPFAAIVLCNFTYEWGVYSIEILFPKFMKEVLHLELKWNDGFYLLPYFGLWFLVMASGGAADRLQSHGVLNTATTRKIMQIIGTVVPASMVAAMGFIDCSQWLAAISFSAIGLSFCGFQYNGFLVNHLDIAPKFAGILMGIASAIGSTASFLVPYLQNVIANVTENQYEQWQTMFLLTAAFYLFSMFFFLICGSGKLQHWAIDKSANNSDTFPTTNPGKVNLFTQEQISDTGFPKRTDRDEFYRSPIEDGNDTVKVVRSPAGTMNSLPRFGGHHPQQQPMPNHLSAGSNPAQDDDILDRKLSNKSTTSSRSNDSKKQGQQQLQQAPRTDHERQRKRDKNRPRSDRDRETQAKRTGSSKKHSSKHSNSRQNAEDSLEIYESLSESPV